VTTQATRFEDLADALRYEARVIDELRQALVRQREGVKVHDVEAIEGSVHAMGRTLLTLEEARRRRATVTSLLTGGDPAPLDSLEASLGRELPEAVIAARNDLRKAAAQSAHEVAINQQILRRAIDAGDAFLQQLFSTAGDAAAVYQPGEHGGETPLPSGLLVNRMA
jgi:hypothetical protein